MKIFITGGTGFIGRAVTALLTQRGYELMLLTRDGNRAGRCVTGQVNYAEGNLADPERLSVLIGKFKPDFVIHLAWEGLPDINLTMCKRNLEYGINLINASFKAGCPNILTTGSCWEYAEKKSALAEDCRLDASNAFPAVKNALRFYGEAAAKEHQGKYYWLRLFYVYGPGQRKSSLIPHIVDSLRQGIPPQCHCPHNHNDFIYVEDVARAILAILEKQPDRTVYNVGSGVSTEVQELIRLVAEAEGQSFNPDWILNGADGEKRNDQRVNFWADIGQITNDTGWFPQHSLASGIKATLSGILRENK